MTRFCNRCRQYMHVDRQQDDCPECGDTLIDIVHEPTVDMPAAEARGGEFPTGIWDPASALPSDSRQDPLLGERIDHYRIERFLGRGGMARVYLARHLELERPCAIKLLREDGAARTHVDAFLHEARAAAALVHPNVVTIHTLGRVGDQRFIEMEYVDGNSLAHHVSADAPLDPLEATRIMLHVSSALAAAHQLKIIHRDIKPGNIMFSHRREAKLADFGLAKRITARGGSKPPPSLCGTPHYMAPELFGGAAAQTVSDVYSVGVTYFNLLTGDLPIRVNSVNELIRLHNEAVPLDWQRKCEHLPPRVCQVLEKCLARDPSNRYRDGAELHEAFCETFASLRSLKQLIDEALANAEVEREDGDNHYRVRVPLDAGRFQWVHVELTLGPDQVEELIRIYSVCGPTSPDYFQQALELNARLPYGAIGIERFRGKECFVMANSFPRATCDLAELQTSLFEIAAHADEVEHLLTGKDFH